MLVFIFFRHHDPPHYCAYCIILTSVRASGYLKIGEILPAKKLPLVVLGTSGCGWRNIVVVISPQHKAVCGSIDEFKCYSRTGRRHSGIR